MRAKLSESGFIVVSYFTLLPIIITIAVGGGFLLSYVIRYNQYQQTCEIKTAQAQKVLANGISDLLALNPEVRRLQRELKSARKILNSASTTPATMAATSAYIAWILVQMAKLRIQQQTIQTKAKVEANRILSEAFREEKTLRSDPPSARMAVYTIPPLIPVAEYRLLPGFSQLQKLRMRWEFSAVPLDLLDADKISGECSVTIKEESQKWLKIQNAGKSWWKL